MWRLSGLGEVTKILEYLQNKRKMEEMVQKLRNSGRFKEANKIKESFLAASVTQVITRDNSRVREGHFLGEEESNQDLSIYLFKIKTNRLSVCWQQALTQGYFITVKVLSGRLQEELSTCRTHTLLLIRCPDRKGSLTLITSWTVVFKL